MRADANPAPSTGRGLRGGHVFLMFAAFFGVVISTNVVFVRLAVSSFPGEQVKKSYYQGLHYNDVLEAREAQRTLGWTLSLVDAPRTAGEQPIRVRLTNGDGAPVRGALVQGLLVRPTTGRGEITLSFDEAADGTYTSAPATLVRGAWQLSIEAVSSQDEALSVSANTRLLIP